MTRPPASPVGAAVGGAVEVAPCRGAGAVWQQTIARAVAPNIARRRASRTGRSLNAGSEPGLTLFWHKTRLPQISGAGAWSALRASRPSRESTGRVSMLTRTKLLVAAVSALALVASACGGSAGPGGGATSAKTVKIYSSLPMTGASRTQTVEIVNSIKMAIDETKINNVTVQFEALDDATAAKGSWDAAQEAENARKAINDKSTVAYIGTYNSGAAKVSIPLLNQAGLVVVSPAHTSPGLTQPGKGEANEPNKYYPNGKRNYFRVVPADDLQGAVGAVWAKDLGAKKVYIVHDN